MTTSKHRAVLFFFVTGCAALFGPWTSGCSSSDEQCIPNCSDKECGSDGCGNTCGCPDGLTCAQNQCLLEGEHTWAMTVIGASIAPTKPDGTVWDMNALPGEDKPDGLLCASSLDGSTCTGTISDTFDPVWGIVLAEPVIDLVHGAVTLHLKDDDSPASADVVCDFIAKFDANTLVTKTGTLQCTSASLKVSFQPGAPTDMYQCRQRFCHSTVEACLEMAAGPGAQDICFAMPSCGMCSCFDPASVGVTDFCTCGVPSDTTGELLVNCP